MSATQFFAQSRGVVVPHGPDRCFYCGGQCDQTMPAAKHVKKTFTALDGVAGGDWVCAGCVEAMDEKADIEMIDGERRTGQKVRCYSWVVTPNKALAATKAHIDRLREICLSPPGTPYMVCLSDSGQKHLLYLGAVCHDPVNCQVTLEGELITYRRSHLKGDIALAALVCSAVGKRALTGPMKASIKMKIHERDPDILDDWLRTRETPLGRLAAWLCPAKKEALEYDCEG